MLSPNSASNAAPPVKRVFLVPPSALLSLLSLMRHHLKPLVEEGLGSGPLSGGGVGGTRSDWTDPVLRAAKQKAGTTASSSARPRALSSPLEEAGAAGGLVGSGGKKSARSSDKSVEGRRRAASSIDSVLCEGEDSSKHAGGASSTVPPSVEEGSAEATNRAARFVADPAVQHDAPVPEAVTQEPTPQLHSSHNTRTHPARTLATARALYAFSTEMVWRLFMALKEYFLNTRFRANLDYLGTPAPGVGGGRWYQAWAAAIGAVMVDGLGDWGEGFFSSFGCHITRRHPFQQFTTPVEPEALTLRKLTERMLSRPATVLHRALRMNDYRLCERILAYWDNWDGSSPELVQGRDLAPVGQITPLDKRAVVVAKKYAEFRELLSESATEVLSTDMGFVSKTLSLVEKELSVLLANEFDKQGCSPNLLGEGLFAVEGDGRGGPSSRGEGQASTARLLTLGIQSQESRAKSHEQHRGHGHVCV